MFELQVDVPKAELLRKANQVEAAVHSGLGRVAEHAQRIAVRQARAIEKRPVPTRGQVNAARRRRGSGRGRATTTDQSAPAWKRTGALLQAVKAAPVFERDSALLTADVAYTETRHGLGVDWQPREPAMGVVRRNPFFTETVEIIEPQIEALFEAGFAKEFEK